MTIVTKPLTAVKSVKETKNVEKMVTVVSVEKKTIATGGNEKPSIASKIVLVLCCLAILILTVMSGVYIYRGMMNHKKLLQKSYMIPLKRDIINDNFPFGYRRNVQNGQYRNFEFNVELDLESNSMEEFELPEVFCGRYLHDFNVNLTVIVDLLGDRCFLMKLDRDVIPKPDNFCDFLDKRSQGLYDLDYEEVKKSFMVSGPALKKFDSTHGCFVPNACFGRNTYELEEYTETVIEKREVGSSSRGLFGEFVGTKLIRYNIVNLANI